MTGKHKFQLLTGLAYFLFVLAAFAPEKLWGVHFLAFLPVPYKLALLLVGGILVFVPKAALGFSGLAGFMFNKSGKFSMLAILIMAGVMFSAFLTFPIAFDIYGDAYQFQSKLSTVLKELPQGFVKDIYKLEFTPSAGRRTVLYTYGLLSHQFDVPYEVVFKWVDAISGLGFVLAWMWFVRTKISHRSWQIILTAVGLLAPLTQIFYLHAEAYAPVFLINLLWLIGYSRYFDVRKPMILGVLTLTLPIVLKLHPVSWLLAVPLVIGWVHHLNEERRLSSKKTYNLNKVAKLIIGLMTFAGVILYFVILKDHQDLRHLNNIKDIDRLFLPLLSPEAPLDRYNLLSVNHILDFFNAMLLWSVPMLLILAAISVVRRKEEKAAQPVMVGLTALIVLQVMLFFMLNPLVSMPMDWDLFSLPAISLLVILVVLVEKNEHLIGELNLKSGILGLLLISSAFIPVNASTNYLSQRLESMGRHIFKTYYLHSNRILISAVGIHGDMDEYMERKDKIEIDLRPYAIVGNDRLYANLFMDDGYYYLNTAQDYDKAKAKLTTAQRYNPELPQTAQLLAQATMFADADDPAKYEERYYRIEQFGLKLMREVREYGKAQVHFQSAIKEYPDSTVLVMFLMESRFQQGDFAGAYYNALTLVEESYPDKIKALRIAIHCALESGMYQEAFKHSEEYLKVKPDDKLILEVYSRLNKMDRPEELRKLFVRR